MPVMKGDSRNSYPFETKRDAVKAHLEGGMTSSEAMRTYDIKSKSAFFRWCVTYRNEGEDSLKPRKRGRPPKNQ